MNAEDGDARGELAAPRRVLVADDEKGHRKVMRKLLEAGGFEVEEAEDGDIAIEKLRTFAPRLVILDSMLPCRPGIECLRAIKASPETRHIPVMICSARGDIGYVLECAESGAAGYIHKPFDAEGFADRVRRAMGER